MQSSIPSTIQTCRVSQPLLARAWRGRRSTPSLNQCSARAAQDIWEHHRPAVGSSMHALGSVHSASEKRQLQALGGAERPPPALGRPGENRDPAANGDRWASAPDPTRCEPQATGKQRSHSLSESTRQITPPIRSGHAPPSTGSRKSSQSVHPDCVLTW